MPMQHTEKSALVLDGLVEPRFAAVREAFFANFEQNLELGAAVAVYYRGKLVVDLAGGLCVRGSETKYSREALQPIFSTWKHRLWIIGRSSHRRASSGYRSAVY